MNSNKVIATDPLVKNLLLGSDVRKVFNQSYMCVDTAQLRLEHAQAIIFDL